MAGEERFGGKALYRLGYPNREVRQSLNRVLLRHLMRDSAARRGRPPTASAWSASWRHTTVRRRTGVVPRLLRQHPVPLAHQQRHCRLLGLLRQRVLLLLRGAQLRFHGGGVEQPRAAGHGGARCRPTSTCSSSRWRRWRRPDRRSPSCGSTPRRQVPRGRRTDPLGGRRVQPRDPQRHRLRSSRRLTTGLSAATRGACRLRRVSGAASTARMPEASSGSHCVVSPTGWLGKRCAVLLVERNRFVDNLATELPGQRTTSAPAEFDRDRERPRTSRPGEILARRRLRPARLQPVRAGTFKFTGASLRAFGMDLSQHPFTARGRQFVLPGVLSARRCSACRLCSPSCDAVTFVVKYGYEVTCRPWPGSVSDCDNRRDIAV